MVFIRGEGSQLRTTCKSGFPCSRIKWTLVAIKKKLATHDIWIASDVREAAWCSNLFGLRRNLTCVVCVFFFSFHLSQTLPKGSHLSVMDHSFSTTRRIERQTKRKRQRGLTIGTRETRIEGRWNKNRTAPIHDNRGRKSDRRNSHHILTTYGRDRKAFKAKNASTVACRSDRIKSPLLQQRERHRQRWWRQVNLHIGKLHATDEPRIWVLEMPGCYLQIS